MAPQPPSKTSNIDRYFAHHSLNGHNAAIQQNMLIHPSKLGKASRPVDDLNGARLGAPSVAGKSKPSTTKAKKGK